MAFSRKVGEPMVLVNGAELPTLKVHSVHRSIGGQRLDSAVLFRDLAKIGDVMQDAALKDEYNGNEIEVVVHTQDGLDIVVHWGKVAIVRPNIDERNCELQYVSRVEPFHFGDPIRGMLVQDNNEGSPFVKTIDEDLVFNPTIDGRVTPNMSSRRQSSGFSYFLDWGSSRTSAARQWRGESASAPRLWSLAEAVMYLMWTGNGAQQYVRNWDQSVQDLEFLLGFTAIKDHRIPRNLYLPQALDRMLEPYGFYWYLEYSEVGSRRIRFQKRGSLEALPAIVGLQKPGEVFDSTITNCENIDISFDNSRNLANVIRVEGDYRYVEATFELQRAWSADFDTLDETDLDRDSDTYLENPEYQRVWRDWVLNEAGDYVGLRAEITQPFNFSALFATEDIAQRRRRFLPTLTRRKNINGKGDDTPAGEVSGVRVEWSNDGGSNWEDVSERDIQIMEKECGIRFNGQVPPEFLVHAATDARVRVTATVRADTRLYYEAVSLFSVQPDRVEAVIDKSDGFHLREVHVSSTYAADLVAGNLTADTVDDSEAIQEYANELVDIWNRAECGGHLTLTGLDWSGFELGNCVPGIVGRNLDFQTHHADARYPQIVAIDYNVRGQTMTLTLDTLRENADPPIRERFSFRRRRR